MTVEREWREPSDSIARALSSRISALSPTLWMTTVTPMMVQDRSQARSIEEIDVLGLIEARIL
jgi:hypothetical protein